jgi:hypothetical protein
VRSTPTSPGRIRSIHPALTWTCYVLIAYMEMGIVTFMHECTHGTMFRRKWMNTAFGGVLDGPAPDLLHLLQGRPSRASCRERLAATTLLSLKNQLTAWCLLRFASKRPPKLGDMSVVMCSHERGPVLEGHPAQGDVGAAALPGGGI